MSFARGNVVCRVSKQSPEVQRDAYSNTFCLIHPPHVSKSNLPPGANRILFVKNLNYAITGEDLYDLFGKYGSIRQIRLGNEAKTKGTAFVVFEDVMEVRDQARSL